MAAKEIKEDQMDYELTVCAYCNKDGLVWSFSNVDENQKWYRLEDPLGNPHVCEQYYQTVSRYNMYGFIQEEARNG